MLKALPSLPNKRKPAQNKGRGLPKLAKMRIPEGECLQPGILPTLRMVWRTSLIMLVTFAFYGAYILCWPIALYGDIHLRKVRGFLSKWWGASILGISSIKLEIEGEAPKAPFFLVANHFGYMDIIVLSRILGCVFIAKDDMSQWPILGWFMKNAHHLFIHREDIRDSSRAMAAVQATLEAGDGIVVFAEARCTRGVDVAPFKPALFQAPVNLEIPVYYAALFYETPPNEPTASDSIVWWRWEPLQQQMGRMLRLRKAKARVRFGAEPVLGADRKQLAQATHAGVCALFEPLAQGVLQELPAPADLPKHLQ